VEPKTCPRCRLFNPPEAQRCDCGYDFAERRLAGSLLPRSGRGGFGAGSAVLLGFLLVPAGVAVGAGLGVLTRVWAAGPGPDGCGLWVLPHILEGLLGDGVLGGVAGLLTTAVVASRWR
jgi:hypothetical protein